VTTAAPRAPWRAAFERRAHENRLSEGEGLPALPWLEALRRAAFERFVAEGFPPSTDEAWLSTNLQPFEEASYAPLPLATAPVGCAAIDPVLRALPKAGRIVFVDGRPAPALGTPLPAGVSVLTLAEAALREPAALRQALALPEREEAHPFVRLSTAFLGQGLWLRCAPGAHVTEPVVVLHVRTRDVGPLALHPRLLVEVGTQARLTLFESYVGLGARADLTNALTQVEVAAGGVLEHVRVQREGHGTTHVGLLKVRLGRDARLHALALSFGAALTRLETEVRLLGEGAHADLDGLFVVDGARRADLVTRVEHLVPRATSRQLVKGVLDGESRGAFTGRVRVAPGAIKTDARQNNHNLLLSPRAQVESRPQLEIDADDVKCSHGATIGRLDEPALFYLRSRGIPVVQARELLVHAFAAEVLARLPDGAARAALDLVLAGGLHEARSPGRAP